jgi:hypothetical protein
MTFKKLLASVAAGFALFTFSHTTAKADTMAFVEGLNQLQYDNREGVFRLNRELGVYEQQAATTLAQPGDIIFGMFWVNNVNSTDVTVGDASAKRLTGVFAQQVTETGLVPVSSVNVNLSDGQSTFALSNYIHTETAGTPIMEFFQAANIGSYDNPAQTMIQMLNTVTNTGSTNPYATFGYNPQSGNGFDLADTANAPVIISFAGLNIFTNNTGWTFTKITSTDLAFLLTIPASAQPTVGPLMPVDLVLHSRIQPNLLAGSRWALSSSDPAFVQTAVPTPAAFWAGLSLLGGMGLLRLRRKQA